MDYLREYRGDDGSIYSWNLRDIDDQRPLYWDSPFFTLYENYSEDERNRLFGNFTTKYNSIRILVLMVRLELICMIL